MTTHVEKALPEPSAEPLTAQSPPGKSSQGAEMLSPVSKLELARKYAAEEQQRRVEKACERMVEVKKAQIVQELEFETSVETRVEQHVAEGELKQQGGRLSSIAMRIVSAFKTTTQETSTTAGEDEGASPTRKLLQATRNKLNALASNGEGDTDLPATNYHLKQLGLANEKINIYAPIQEQQNEIRRRRESAIRCQEKYMQENAEYPGDEGYKSGEDSDFALEEDEDVDADAESDSDDDDDDDSDVEIDAEEVRQLLADQSEFAHSVKTLKKHAKRTKKAKASKSLVPTSPISILGAFLALLLALALAIFFAEQQSGFCRALVAQTPRAEEPRIVTCNVVLRVEAFFLSILRALPFQSSA